MLYEDHASLVQSYCEIDKEVWFHQSHEALDQWFLVIC
jgi:hypothetical protein